METSDARRKLTVLFVFHECNAFSGATRSLIDILDSYLLDESVNIVALFPAKRGTAIDYLKNKDVKIITNYHTWVIAPNNEPWIRKLAFPYRWLRYLVSTITTFMLKNTIKNLNIDCVYTNTGAISVGGLINRFFHIPHVWHFRELVEEGLDHKYIFGRKRFNQFASKYADRIVVTSEAMYEAYYKYFLADKLKIIYDDVSPIYINPKTKFDLDKKNIQLLIAGTLCDSKGQYEVLQAVKIIVNHGYDITLNIAGNTDCIYFSKLSDYVTKNYIKDFVVFHGLVQDMNKLRSNMDVEIVASHFEAFGRVTIEGMLSSLVVIGRDSGATSELICDGETGLLYEPNNVNDLADKVEYLFHNRSEIKRLATNGFQYALENFTVGICSRSLLDSMWEVKTQHDSHDKTI